jgi:hypothetical protein
VGPRRRWVGIVGVSLLVLTATARAGPGASAQASSLRVSMYGDSVLLGAREDLLAQFADQQATVDAVEDRSLLGAIGLFRSAGPALGDVVVLDLGYNDASDPTVFGGRIDDAMAALAGVKRVIWLNQHEWGPGRARMNAVLAAAGSRYPNLDVVDWNAEVSAHPDEVYADSIHLTPSGQLAMAALVREEFDRYVASVTPATSSPTTDAEPTSAGSVSRSHSATRASSLESASGGALDDRALALVAVVGLLLVGGVLSLVGRGGGQRRASSSARSASGSVTGSRQANRSQT